MTYAIALLTMRRLHCLLFQFSLQRNVLNVPSRALSQTRGRPNLLYTADQILQRSFVQSCVKHLLHLKQSERMPYTAA